MSVFIFSHNKQINYYHIFGEAYFRKYPKSKSILFVHGKEELSLAQQYDSYSIIIDVLENFNPKATVNTSKIHELELSIGESFFWEDVSLDRWLFGIDSTLILEYSEHFYDVLEKAFHKYKPTCAIGEFTRTSYRLAFRYFKKNNLPFYHFETSRYFDRHFIYDNLNWFDNRINQKHEEFMSTKPEIPLFIESLYTQVVTNTAKLSYSRNNEGGLPSIRNKIFRKIQRWISKEMTFDNLIFRKSKKSLLEGIVDHINSHFSLFQLNKLTAFKRIEDLNIGDYAVYFLHYQPEYTVEGLGLKYTNQEELIKTISISLPVNMTLLVKEHLPMIGSRSPEFYKRLSRLPNVKLVAPNIRGTDLIRNCKISFTISGTVAIESIMFLKPCIVFSKYFGSNAFIKEVSDIRGLNKLIFSALQDTISRANYEEYAKYYLYSRYVVSRDGRVPVYENNYNEFLSDKANLEKLINSFAEIF